MGTDKKKVTVTHPFSPDKGKEFTLVHRLHYWGDDRLILLDENGKRRRINASWTDYEPQTLFREVSDGRAYLSDDKAEELMLLLQAMSKSVK